ncbi:hypothetical protein GIY62_19945 [Burkholderia plantarii]|nr:hypothetical protein GIY62_19945 [Burkholderia plantarii]
MVVAVTVVTALVATGLAPRTARAQQAPTNPGDLIVIRTVTPRIAYHPVPTDQNPVAVRATTFPANTFDPTMAAVASDVDLTNARGSAGVAAGNLAGSTTTAAAAAVARVLTGDLNGPGARAGIGSVTVPTGAMGGIGGTVSTAVTGAISPLVGALGAIK